MVLLAPLWNSEIAGPTTWNRGRPELAHHVGGYPALRSALCESPHGRMTRAAARSQDRVETGKTDLLQALSCVMSPAAAL